MKCWTHRGKSLKSLLTFQRNKRRCSKTWEMVSLPKDPKKLMIVSRLIINKRTKTFQWRSKITRANTRNKMMIWDTSHSIREQQGNKMEQVKITVLIPQVKITKRRPGKIFQKIKKILAIEINGSNHTLLNLKWQLMKILKTRKMIQEASYLKITQLMLVKSRQLIEAATIHKGWVPQNSDNFSSPKKGIGNNQMVCKDLVPVRSWVMLH